jgi:hypothetical protein
MPDQAPDPSQPSGGAGQSGSGKPASGSERGGGATGGGGAGASGPLVDPGDLAKLLEQLRTTGGLPITLSLAPTAPVDTITRLNARPPVTMAFPSCVEVLLGLIRTTGVGQDDKDEITTYFDEYFKFGVHEIIDASLLRGEIDSALMDCLTKAGSRWPTPCCLCPSCIKLDGNRNGYASLPIVPSIRRLFIGDLVWLFYFDRMGIFRILGVILDDFARRGRLPISNGSLGPDIRDDIAALVLEVMVRETKTGMSSTVRDRESSYRRTLGWTLDPQGRLKQDTQTNTGFSELFHTFVSHALEFYAARRLAVAIRGATVPAAPPSAATLVTIGRTIDVLKKRFEVFDYGRNYYNTLNGIIWAIAGMTVVRELRRTLGIPEAFDRPHEYIPAAYDLLVAGRSVTEGETNRYTLHRDSARNARDLLLDIQVLGHETTAFAEPGGELDRWLTQVEGRIEGYRTAYQALTGIDLGATGARRVEQQV